MKSLIILFFVFSFLASAEEPAATVSPLQKAYQKELLFLNSYKTELKQKIRQLDKDVALRVKLAEKELVDLEARYVNSQTANELLVSRLSNLERENERKMESGEALNTVMEQAQITYGKESLPEGESVSLVQKMEAAFSTAQTALNSATTVQKSAGEFYSENGELVKGDILQLGGVARYGVSSQVSGPLYPAGAGKFQVFKSMSKTSLESLAQGTLPESLPVFLFESAEKAFVPPAEKTWLSTVQSGGSIAWVIVGIGLLALLLSGVRWMLLKKASPKGEEEFRQIISVARTGDYEKAGEMCRTHDNAVGRVLAPVIAHIEDPEKIEDVITEGILHESQTIDRFGSFILVLASIAPLLGLLGTVTGMISTFDIITEFGTGNPKLLSGGISEALVTTMLGLIVAIPALVMGQYLNSWSENLKDQIEKVVLGLTNAVKNGEAEHA